LCFLQRPRPHLHLHPFPTRRSSDLHHVAASILLKQEDKGMAWLAADRSVQAAHASQSPLMVGSSSRIITHALMDGGHHRTATDRSEEHTSELQSRENLVCRLLLEKK